MKKKLLSLLLTIILAIFGSYVLAFLCRPLDNDTTIQHIRAFHEMPDDCFDVIIYGSSHAQRGFSSTKLYDEFGIRAYNYGANWQRINTTRLFLEDSLRTQNPKVVLIETYYANSYEKDVYPDGQISYTMCMDSFDGKIKFLRECFGNDVNKWFSYYFPLCAFHENWKGLCKDSFSLRIFDTSFHHMNMGFSPSELIIPNTIANINDDKQVELSEKAVEILQDMVNICNDRDIDVIFYTVPYDHTFIYSDAMKDFCNKNECKYFNLYEYVEEVGLDEKTDFSDKDHLNTYGSEKVASFFGKYIKDNYDLVDYRTIENNDWIKARNSTN